MWIVTESLAGQTTFLVRNHNSILDIQRTNTNDAIMRIQDCQVNLALLRIDTFACKQGEDRLTRQAAAVKKI